MTDLLIVVAGTYEQAVEFLKNSHKDSSSPGVVVVQERKIHEPLRNLRLDDADEVAFVGTWYTRKDIPEIRKILKRIGWKGDKNDDPTAVFDYTVGELERVIHDGASMDEHRRALEDAKTAIMITRALLGLN